MGAVSATDLNQGKNRASVAKSKPLHGVGLFDRYINDGSNRAVVQPYLDTTHVSAHPNQSSL